jgi:hypothetical protein
MTDERRREIELIVELAMTTLDLKFTEAIHSLEHSVNTRVDEKLEACQLRHEQRRRWNIGTWISIIGPIVAAASAIAAHMR